VLLSNNMRSKDPPLIVKTETDAVLRDLAAALNPVSSVRLFCVDNRCHDVIFKCGWLQGFLKTRPFRPRDAPQYNRAVDWGQGCSPRLGPFYSTMAIASGESGNRQPRGITSGGKIRKVQPADAYNA
jgi:hypothetical protein